MSDTLDFCISTMDWFTNLKYEVIQIDRHFFVIIESNCNFFVLMYFSKCLNQCETKTNFNFPISTLNLNTIYSLVISLKVDGKALHGVCLMLVQNTLYRGCYPPYYNRLSLFHQFLLFLKENCCIYTFPLKKKPTIPKHVKFYSK